MHGLINRSFQCFVRDMHGADAWHDVAIAAGFPEVEFEALLNYDDELTERLLESAEVRLGRPRTELLEDMGTYLASHPNFEPARRLLRFGGASYADFLHSLDDLEGRARLAVPDLSLPELTLVEHSPGAYSLISRFSIPGASHVLVGLLRAMADDYGALGVIERVGARDGAEVLAIQVLDADFAEGRHFTLSTGSAQ